MKKNKTLIIFLFKFFISYFLMFGLYNVYLSKNQQKIDAYSCSPITKIVAEQSAMVSNFLGYKTEIIQHNKELSFKVLVNDKYIARVIEGCTAVSVIILFLSFIIAFTGKITATIIFGLIGSILIYVLNIIRVGLLSIGLYLYPKQETIMHDILFPAIIYGFIVLLWLLWIKKYAQVNNKNV